MKTAILKHISVVNILVLLFASIVPLLMAKKTEAAVLAKTSIRLNRLGASVVASSTNPILVVFRPTTTIPSGNSPKVKITWPTSSAFTVSGTAASHTTSTTCVPATYQGDATDTLTITGNAASAVAAGLVTFDVGEALTAGTSYAYCLEGGITNPSTGNAGTHIITVDTYEGGTPRDAQNVAVDILTTNGDQIAVTATVPAAFNFQIAGSPIALGTLSTSARTTGTATVDIETNANNGWIAWIRSEGGTDTLASASSGDAISSTDTGSTVTTSTGSEGYVVDVSIAAGSLSTGSRTVATEYDGDSSTSGGVIDTAYEQIAQSTGVADSDIVTLRTIVTISAVNEAATDYTDTWEVIGAGNF